MYGVYNNQINARNAFPRRDAYDTAISQTNLNLAITLANKGKLSQQEKDAIQTLISESIRSTRIATETLDPLNLNNWLVRASIYRTLIGVTSDADQWAIPANSPDLEKLSNEIADVKAKTKVAGASTKASVQQIENKDGQNSDTAAKLTKPDTTKNSGNLDKAVNETASSK